MGFGRGGNHGGNSCRREKHLLEVTRAAPCGPGLTGPPWTWLDGCAGGGAAGHTWRARACVWPSPLSAAPGLPSGTYWLTASRVLCPFVWVLQLLMWLCPGRLLRPGWRVLPSLSQAGCPVASRRETLPSRALALAGDLSTWSLSLSLSEAVLWPLSATSLPSLPVYAQVARDRITECV